MSSGTAWLRRMVQAAVVCLVILGAVWLLGHFPWWVETLFSRGVFPAVAWLQGLLVGSLPFSLAEASLLAVAVALVAGAVSAVRLWRRLRWRGIGIALSALLAAGLILTVTGYGFWGLNYARPPLRERIGWVAPQQFEPDWVWSVGAELAAVLAETGRPDAEAPAEAALEWGELDRALRGGFAAARRELGVEWRQPPGRVKPLWASRLLSHLGISGFYFPWTGEANVNVDIPEVQIPHVAAHEKAHQLGIAPEDEANFVAFVACLNSGEPAVVYSGALFGFGQVYRQMRRRAPDGSRALWQQLPEGARQDLRRISEYWRQFEGPVERVATRVNDRYLRSQGVRGGVQSYGRSLGLILSYWQRNPREGKSTP